MAPLRATGVPIAQSAILRPPSFIVREADVLAPNRDDQIHPSRMRLGRDLTPAQHRQMINVSHALYKLNPLARRLINMMVDFIIDSGPTLQSDHAPNKEYLTEWWENEWNDWPNKIHRRIRDLLVYGEWLHIPAKTRGGMVYINVAQPDVVEEVVVLDAHHEMVDYLTVRDASRDGSEIVGDHKRIPVIRPHFDPRTEELNGYEGEVFLFGINKTTDTTRGIGELFTLIDSIDVFEQMLFSRAEKISQAASMWWDLTLEGHNKQMIDDYLRNEARNLPPKSGTVWAHNERATLDWKFPNTNADEFAEDVRTQKSHIISSAGFPGTYFDEPGDAGRAVGAEMAEPTFKTVRSMQNQIAGFIRTEMRFALWHARASNVAGVDPDKPFQISFPSPNARDIQRIGPALFRLSQALQLDINSGIMSPKQAASVLGTQINRLGLSDMPFTLDDLTLEDDVRKIANDGPQAPNPARPPGGQINRPGQPTQGQPGEPTQPDQPNAQSLSVNFDDLNDDPLDDAEFLR